MQTSLLMLLLVCILVQAGTGAPSERRGQQQGGRDRFATWDNVNIVAHGLLQLGQGLKEHVDKSKVQMRDIASQLRAFNGTVAQLERQNRQGEEALKSTVLQMEQRETLAERLADEARVMMEEMKAQNRDIHARMDRVEERVEQEQLMETNNSVENGPSFVQRLLEAQNKRIDDLVEKIKQQQDKLEKQSVHLQTLQDKVTQKRVKSHRRRDGETALKRHTEQEPNGLAKDCHDLYLRGERDSGVYTVQPLDSNPFDVLCEMTSERGWTIIQKRQDGSQNFNQLWRSYQRGFGSLNGEFWLGLENIYSLSKQGQNTLQVQLTDRTGAQESASYQFRLDGEENNYALHLHHGSSEDLENTLTTGPSGLAFSTSDRDNDLSADINCAMLLSGGWWFSDCGQSNLNGQYPLPSGVRTRHSRMQRMFWKTLKRHHNSLKTVVLRIAPSIIKQ